MKTTDYKQQKQYEMAKEVSIIGKKYKSNDNSWQLNLSNHEGYTVKSDSIAGTCNTLGKVCTVLTEPFEMNIYWMDKHLVKTFLMVTDEDGNSHITLFDERSILS